MSFTERILLSIVAVSYMALVVAPALASIGLLLLSIIGWLKNAIWTHPSLLELLSIVVEVKWSGLAQLLDLVPVWLALAVGSWMGYMATLVLAGELANLAPSNSKDTD